MHTFYSTIATINIFINVLPIYVRIFFILLYVILFHNSVVLKYFYYKYITYKRLQCSVNKVKQKTFFCEIQVREMKINQVLCSDLFLERKRKELESETQEPVNFLYPTFLTTVSSFHSSLSVLVYFQSALSTSLALTQGGRSAIAAQGSPKLLNSAFQTSTLYSSSSSL